MNGMVYYIECMYKQHAEMSIRQGSEPDSESKIWRQTRSGSES